jgi:hypothetical protein
MTTNVDYTDSTAGRVLRGLREPLNSESEQSDSARSEAGKPHLETVPAPPEQEASSADVDSEVTITAARRFIQVNWTGEEPKGAEHAETSSMSGAAESEPSGRPLTAAERFQAVAWDSSEAEKRRTAEYEQQQKLAEQRSQQMKVKNFFGNANF